MIGSQLWERLRGRRPPNYRAVNIRAEVVSDIGCCRETNEDCACCIHPKDESVLLRKGVLAVIADGMGGLPAGELASRVAVEEITQTYYNSASPPEAALRRAFETAHTAIRDRSRENENAAGMGTTCTAIAILQDVAVFAHIGDTRLYMLRGEEFRQLTEDHTRVMRMVKEGLLTREQARCHDDRNVILQALGQRNSIEKAQWGQAIGMLNGDRFVLCSDGLYDQVEDAEILESIVSQTPAAACRTLVGLARDRGGFDNISVVVISIGTPDEPPRAKGRATHGDQEAHA